MAKYKPGDILVAKDGSGEFHIIKVTKRNYIGNLVGLRNDSDALIDNLGIKSWEGDDWIAKPRTKLHKVLE